VTGSLPPRPRDLTCWTYGPTSNGTYGFSYGMKFRLIYLVGGESPQWGGVCRGGAGRHPALVKAMSARAQSSGGPSNISHG
jgi:hypothetical protein